MHTLFQRAAWKDRGWLFARNSVQFGHANLRRVLTSDIGAADEQIWNRPVEELPRKCFNAISRCIDAGKNVTQSGHANAIARLKGSRVCVHVVQPRYCIVTSAYT